MLAADVPYLEVDGRVWRWEGNGSDILAHSGHGAEVGVGRGICAFYLLEESCFTSIVKAEEQDRVLWARMLESAGA